MSDETHGLRLSSLSATLMQREVTVPPEGAHFGRDGEQCEVVVSGLTISRRHLWVGQDANGNWLVRDLASTNGTYLNGARIENEAFLRQHQILGLGGPDQQHFRIASNTGERETGALILPQRQHWSIGRAPDVDIQLANEPTVSAYHAEIRRVRDDLMLTDLGSRNGTVVNGDAIRSRRITPADIISLGAAELRIESLADGGLRVLRGDANSHIRLESLRATQHVPSGLRKTPMRILSDVTLAIEPGEFVGILGPSGAGKSTLLKTMNGYMPPTEGQVLLNQVPLYERFELFRNLIGYVPQDDIIHQELRVRDSLDYIARLRLPADVSSQQRADLINTTLEDLGLGHVAEQRIAALSGGQRKRVSIGAELITRPSVLFLDEPTSGLDPSTEERLMRRFRSMARRGTTTLITTHILYNLSMLDRIIILARGRLCFFGHHDEALHFFAAGDESLERPTQIFEILEGVSGHGFDHLIEQSDEPQIALAEHFEQSYRNSDFFRHHVTQHMSVMPSARGDPAEPETTTAATPAPRRRPLRNLLGAFSAQSMRTLVARHFAVKLTSARAALLYMMVPVALALVTLSMSVPPAVEDAEAEQRRDQLRQTIETGPLGLEPALRTLLAPNSQGDDNAVDIIHAIRYEGLANLPIPVSVLIMFVMMAVFTGTLMACLELSGERHIFRREYMANQRIPDYLVSKLPFLFSLTAVQCAVFLAICCLKPELRSMDLAWVYTALVAMSWTAVAIGLFLSAADPTRGQVSVVLAVAAVLPQLVLSGGLGPDFYSGMNAATARIADLLPARWGLTMLMSAALDRPDSLAHAWIGDFVPDRIGFGFGSTVYPFALAALLLQLVAWLLLSGAMIRYRCKPR